MSGNIIYAPPMDIPSFQLSVTQGCSHNKCTFCNMFQGIPFRAVPMDEIESELQEASVGPDSIDRVFMDGGDAFVLPASRLLEIAELIHHYLPKVRVISSYASVKNIKTKTDDELHALAQAGIGEINIGVESGLDDVLTFMNKGFTLSDARRQLLRLRKADIPFSMNIIGGAVGVERIHENALASAELCNEVKPALIYFMGLQVNAGTELERRIHAGEFRKANLGEYLTEELAFLQRLDLDNCTYYAAHMLNPIPLVGALPNDKERLLQELRNGISQCQQQGLLKYQQNY
ncbi:MAG: radical SAM protein [Eubacterium sp.]|nr:radical SAM protein [Eubacterium sp.]